jgi:hypothetical protein
MTYDPNPGPKRQCIAKCKKSGERCKNLAMKGGTVCRFHGGSVKRIRKHADKRYSLEEARKVIEAAASEDGAFLPAATDIEDPVTALMTLAAEAIALVRALRVHVDRLETVATEGGMYGEQVKPEIQAYLAAIHQAERTLTNLARLDLAERFVRLDEARADLVVLVIERVLKALGVDHKDRDVRRRVSNELQVASAV